MSRRRDPVDDIADALGWLAYEGARLAGKGAFEGGKLLVKALRPIPEGVAIGRDLDLTRKPVVIAQRDRLKHAHVKGATGSGKTSLLANMIVQDLNATDDYGRPRYGVGVIDPKGDLIDRIIDYIPPRRLQDVVILDATDTEFPLGFNILESDSTTDKFLTTSSVIATLEKVYSKFWGTRMEHFLRHALLSLMDFPEATLLDIYPLYLNPEFRARVVERLADHQLRVFWEREFTLFSKGRSEGIHAVEPILNKIGEAVVSEKLRNIIGQTTSSFNLRDIMDRKQVFLARLTEGLLGEDHSRLLGGLLVSRLQLAATSRANIPEHRRSPFILYVDEFQNFVTTAFEKSITEARSFGMGLVVANQHDKQFHEQPGLGATIEHNVAAMVTCVKDRGQFRLLYERPQDIGYEPALLRPLEYLQPLAGERRVQEMSRLRHGRPRDEVEEDILRRMRDRYEGTPADERQSSAEEGGTGGTTGSPRRWRPQDFYEPVNNREEESPAREVSEQQEAARKRSWLE